MYNIIVIILIMNITVYYFTTSSGKNPVKEFIQQQDKLTSTQLDEMILTFKKYGFSLPQDQLKKIAGVKDLWELRVKSEGNIYRIFVGKIKNFAVLLHIIQKKSQKTPPKDIKTALSRLEITKKYGGI